MVVFGWNKVEDGFLAWDGLGERFCELNFIHGL